MTKYKLFFLVKIIIFFLVINLKSFAEESNKNHDLIVLGDNNAPVKIKIFSSLTCPHCANFHEEIILKIKDDYLDTNLVKFEHHSFPLDLAALNAEKILNCFVDKEKKFNFLTQIYKKQKKWAFGSDINIINDSIKKIGGEIGLSYESMEKCLTNKEIEDRILDERISAQKKYKISSTPTIYINKKQYKGKHNYKLFKEELDKSF